MKLKFRIYWFEDDIGRLDWFNTIEWINSIKQYLLDKWFYPEITFYINKKSIPDRYSNVLWLDTILLQDFNDKHLETIDFSNVDLVLMDFHLGEEEENWDKIISYIRNNENNIFTDIFFYSENKNETELRGIADRDWLYCSNWNEIFTWNKIIKVINTLIRKTQDLNNLRWLVMAEVSELEWDLKTINSYIALNNLVEKNKIDERIPKKISDLEDSICGLKKMWNFSELLESKEFNSFFSLRTLKSFSDSNLNSLEKDAYKDFEEEIIKIRNILGHYPEESSNDKLLIKWEEFTEEKFIAIRKNIKKHKEILKLSLETIWYKKD